MGILQPSSLVHPLRFPQAVETHQRRQWLAENRRTSRERCMKMWRVRGRHNRLKFSRCRRVLRLMSLIKRGSKWCRQFWSRWRRSGTRCPSSRFRTRGFALIKLPLHPIRSSPRHTLCIECINSKSVLSTSLILWKPQMSYLLGWAVRFLTSWPESGQSRTRSFALKLPLHPISSPPRHTLCTVCKLINFKSILSTWKSQTSCQAVRFRTSRLD